MFLRQEERDAAQILSSALARDGVDIRLNTNAVNVRVEGNHKLIDLISDDNQTTVVVDQILVGAGRTPNVQEINLEAAGVAYDDVAGVRINDFLQTTNSRIYASGDVCLEHKFMHIEDASAQLVVRNALFWGRQRLSRLTIPWCTYTDPEIAHGGLYVTDAIRKGIPVKTFTIPMHEVDRAIANGEEEGFVKIHVKEERRPGARWQVSIVARASSGLPPIRVLHTVFLRSNHADRRRWCSRADYFHVVHRRTRACRPAQDLATFPSLKGSPAPTDRP